MVFNALNPYAILFFFDQSLIDEDFTLNFFKDYPTRRDALAININLATDKKYYEKLYAVCFNTGFTPLQFSMILFLSWSFALCCPQERGLQLDY